MIKGLSRWHYHCTNCGYAEADINPFINSEGHSVRPNKQDRETGLKTVREQKLTVICDLLEQFEGGNGKRLLDVGCDHGWFLIVAATSYCAESIEPHREVAQHARPKGSAEREGYFPDVLNNNDVYDAIVSNEVLEHKPQIGTCDRVLDEDSILVLNLSNSSGVLSGISKLLARIEWNSMFQRMRQLSFPSSHLHYFGSKNLCTLTESYGFTNLYCGRRHSLTCDGLFQRITHTGEYSPLSAALLYCAAWLSVPILKHSPVDIQLQFFRQQHIGP
jgi:hypothetical protein